MKRYWKHSTLMCLILIGFAFTVRFATPIYFEVPDKWPKPVYDFSKNPITEEGFQLGRNLFYDPILSRDKTISCASCHSPNNAFTHVDHDLSHGIEGRKGKRNSLALVNLAWSKNFMWDGGVNNLEVQPINPITNPVEMDEKLENVVTKLQQSPKYRTLFSKAYGDEKVTSQRILKALAQFTVMLKSSDSKYDKVMRHEASFTQQEEKGYQLFKANCASCHTEPLFSSDKFENNGLKPDDSLKDGGRIKITKNIKDSLRFKVPTLRNIKLTGPYMHDGSIQNLPMVLFHYTDDLYKSPSLSKQLTKKITLNKEDKDNLIAFLEALTDESFIHNPKFQYPR
ncbi:cytochrome-c peroxidase [Flavobacterium wongokense]|uniref:cytochrome-c peroxidase n=1 Tax=Flavobacterium wongokense TaxID=2910674 RepID=UPI001F1FC695|nr:cytochrome c peroxidase [Flavobacterium sp. WG47]MCF6132127.1 c-type cytochrome [Flavobacterium sp. WG47]